MDKFRIADNRMIHVDGHDFIFLVADKAIFEMDPLTKDLLSRWSGEGEFTREAFFEGVADPPEERDSFFEGFLDRHAIVSVNGKMPEKKATDPGRARIPLETLVLHVTDVCNLGCLYCYEEKVKPAAGRRKHMRPEVARKAVDFVLEHSGAARRIVLVFFGGEPLLNLELIKSTTGYARQQAGKKGKQVDFAMTTNGTLLTEEAIDVIIKNDIGVTVSMDGSPEVHDRYRRFPDGSPSHGRILPGLKKLLQGPLKRPVVARATVVKDPEDVPRMLDSLLALGFVEAGFSPVTTGNPEYQLDKNGMDRLLSQFRNLSNRFLESARKGEFFGFSNLIDLLVVLHQGEVMDYPCGAGLGLFSVNPEGRLFLCQRFTNQDEFCMGDIFQGVDRIKLSTFRKEAVVSQKEDCKSCWARTVCTGGCYHEACVREGSHLKPNLHYCEWIRRWTEIGLEVYGKISVSCPDYLDKLSMSRGHAPIFNQ